MSLLIFEGFLDRYIHILSKRTKKLQVSISQENFIRARASFDEVFKTIMYKDTKTLQGKDIVKILLEAIGANEDLLHSI